MRPPFCLALRCLPAAAPAGDDQPVVHFDEKGEPGADLKRAAGSLRVEVNSDGAEVVLTNPKPGKEWKLDWIDVYRR